jgi:hypothetical protein
VVSGEYAFGGWAKSPLFFVELFLNTLLDRFINVMQSKGMNRIVPKRI